MIDEGRRADLAMLQNQLRKASPETAKKIMHTMHNIQNESSLQRSMRADLIKATRNGDVKAAKEIREYVAETKKYRND